MEARTLRVNTSDQQLTLREKPGAMSATQLWFCARLSG